MKKILALALALMLCLCSVAFADDATYTDMSTVTITKKYTATNNGVSPAETFSFSALTCTGVVDGGVLADGTVITKDNAPVPTIGSITYAEGEATADGTGTGTKTATITLPSYDVVGVYTYSFNEITPDTETAGVTYNDDTLYLVVTVIEQNGKVRVASVHTEGSTTAKNGEAGKTDSFDNSYESGTLAVTKNVTGNMGDKDKYFDVTVTFAAAEGEVINSTIKYSGGKYDSEVTVTNNTATIQVKHGDTVTFTNVPEGVTWTVVEADYRGEGYDEAAYTKSSDSIAAGDADACTITNNKGVAVDTGIALDNAPYMIVLALVVVAGVMMMKKRSYNA